MNSRNIPGPEGRPWGTSTLVEILRGNRLNQYAGIYYWNKEDHNTPGKRFKDKKEWVEVVDAHPAILTKEEVEAAQALTSSRQPRTPAARSYDSEWLLTGLNLEGKSFFTCKVCGKNVIGVRDSVRHKGKYCCGQHHYKGTAGCSNNFRLNSLFIEHRLLSEIEKVFGKPESIESLVNQLNLRVSNELSNYKQSIDSIQRELSNLDKQIEQTFEAFESGLDPELCKERQVKLKNQRIELTAKLEQLKKDQPQPLVIDPKKAREYFENIKKIFEHGTNEQKRNFFKTYIRSLDLDPEKRQVNVVFYPHNLQEKIKHGNGSPYFISSGVGGGT